MNESRVKTSQHVEFIDITSKAQNFVKSSGVKNGICHLYVPHTTAGITINESADPDVVKDIADQLEELVPGTKNYRHREGNADSHIKSSIVGNTADVFIDGGQLKLGTWQGIFFCEFDGPRTRKVWMEVAEL